MFYFKGDSGAPLVCSDGEKEYLYGVVSGGTEYGKGSSKVLYF